MMDSHSVGIAAWTCDDRESAYGQPFYDRINKDALADFASSLRDNRPCTISDKFSVGRDNLVLQIKFNDDVKWIAKLRAPPMLLDVAIIEKEKRHVPRQMESELTTMEFVRQKTAIPIPKVHGYDFSENNAVGCPFLMMDYVEGRTADAMSMSYPAAYPGEFGHGVPAQFREKFRRQVSQYIVQLASIRFPQIGSITRDESGSFVVGPLAETESGPYSSASEFYANYPLALDKRYEGGSVGQTEVLQEFITTAQSFEAQGSQNGFGLANFKLSGSNILVDPSFNVLAVTGWGSVAAVPDAALYHVPDYLTMDLPFPGTSESFPSVRRRFAQEFTAFVEAVGREMGDHERPILTQRGYFSKEAVAFRALLDVKMFAYWVNEDLLAALRWLQEHSEADIAEFYLAPDRGQE